LGEALSTPSDTLWDYEDHTRAKHQLLVGYLNAWYPIMARVAGGAVNVIDGFAGPGRYKDGEPGSPLLMIDAFVNHRDSPAMQGLDVYFDFIEERHDRAAYLQDQLSQLALPANVHLAPVHQGSFDAVMGAILDAIPAMHALAPTFAFIDPFGYTGHGLELSSRILQFRKCEVLIYVPLPFIARFIGETSIEPTLDNLFGDSSWKEARAVKGKAAERILHQCFLAHVRKAAGYAVSFEIDASIGKGWSGYTLYFGTGNPVGLERMKEAMWKIDPASGARFAYSVDPDQLTIFEAGAEVDKLESALRSAFGMDRFTIDKAWLFTTLNTPFAPRMHLKTRTLAVAEAAGRLEAKQPGNPKRRRGQYPPGTELRFTV
jgi:three-Cys-motif partner protein